MAKKQKNLHFPPEVFDWLDREEDRRGPKPVRFVIAGLLAYRMLPQPLEEVFMSAASRVDKGRETFAKATERLKTMKLISSQSQAKALRDLERAAETLDADGQHAPGSASGRGPGGAPRRRQGAR